MRLVGLTGGIACGKSAVSAILQEERVAVIDCDAIAHQLMRKGSWSWRRVVAAFGRDILLPNGEVDRAKLGQVVWGDRAARRRLNRATHLPLAVCLVGHIAWHWLTCRSLVVVDMPLLFETGAQRLLKPVVVVACSEEVQLQRLVAREGCSKEEAAQRVAAQMPLEAKVAAAQHVLWNDGDLAQLRHKVLQLVPQLRRGGALRAWLLSPLLPAAAVAIAIWHLVRR